MHDPNAENGDSVTTLSASLELTRPIAEVEFSSTKVLDGESRLGVTTVVFAPDGNLYSADILGNILRYELNPETGLATSTTLVASVGQTVTGLVVDPDSSADSIALWVSSYQIPAEPYTSKISRVDGAEGGAAQVTDVITGLPNGGHGINGLEFGPDGQLYIAAGGLASLGDFSSGGFGFAETLLSAAVLTADVKNDPAFTVGPVDVTTEGSGAYDPYASGAPVKIYATGLRNIYDLEWTKNTAGESILVAGDNGNSLNGALTPDDPNTPTNEQLQGVKPSEKFIVVSEGGYYGHSNPIRGEYIYNGGNPTYGNDPWQITQYPSGTLPEPGFDPDAILNLDQHDADSPNGIETYIDGTILQTTFTGGRKILYITVDGNGTPVYCGDLQKIGGGDLSYTSPLDIAVDEATGRIYVANFGVSQSNPSDGAIFLVAPEEGALLLGSEDPVDPVDPIDVIHSPTEPPALTERIEAENLFLNGDYRGEGSSAASGDCL